MFLTSPLYALAPPPVQKFDEIHVVPDGKGGTMKVRVWVEETPDASIIRMEQLPPLKVKLKSFLRKSWGIACNAILLTWVAQIILGVYYLIYLCFTDTENVFLSTALIWVGGNWIVVMALQWLEKRRKVE